MGHVRGLKDPTDVGAVDDETPRRLGRAYCKALTDKDVCDADPKCKWNNAKSKCKVDNGRRLAVDAGIFDDETPDDDDTPDRRLRVRCRGKNEPACTEADECVWVS